MMTIKSWWNWVLAAAAWPQAAEGACRVTNQGSMRSGDVLLKGTVLTSQGPMEDGAVLIQNGRIISTGPRGDYDGGYSHVRTLDCMDSVITPGFINTHEHIEYATVRPFLYTGVLYNHRHEWRKGLRGYPELDAPVNGSELHAAAWGELRHLFSGTTSLVGGAYAPGLARNLDSVAGLGAGLAPPTDTTAVFPLDDGRGIMRAGNCDYGAAPADAETVGKAARYLAHVAEGVGPAARNEFACLSNASFDTTPRPDGRGGTSADVVGPNVALIHALALGEEDFKLVARRGAMVVWSPRSNIFLYGTTFDVRNLLDLGITVALGTDWLPSGSATMGREAVCARNAAKQGFGYEISAKTLWEMMTVNAAKVAGFEHDLGSIEPGKLADIAVWGGRKQADPYSQAIYSPGHSIELVLRGGEVVLAANQIKDVATGKCEEVKFGQTTKTVCVEVELNSTFADFKAKLDGVYPAVLPGVPPDEPNCHPTR